MIYLFATVALQLLAVVQVFRLHHHMANARTTRQRLILSSTVLLMLFASILAAAPFINEIAQHSATSIVLDGWRNSPYLPWYSLGAASVLGVAGYGLRFHVLAKDSTANNQNHWAIGANVCGIMASIYLGVVVVDQLNFYRPPSTDAGMLNWGLMRDDKSITDVHCEQAIMAVKGIDSGVATYRCPVPVTIIFGQYSSAPLIPWLSYSEGTSKSLADAVQRMRREADSAH